MAAARARGAVLGSLVADAAAVPVHWCYDPEKLAEHLKQALGVATNFAVCPTNRARTIMQVITRTGSLCSTIGQLLGNYWPIIGDDP